MEAMSFSVRTNSTTEISTEKELSSGASSTILAVASTTLLGTVFCYMLIKRRKKRKQQLLQQKRKERNGLTDPNIPNCRWHLLKYSDFIRFSCCDYTKSHILSPPTTSSSSSSTSDISSSTIHGETGFIKMDALPKICGSSGSSGVRRDDDNDDASNIYYYPLAAAPQHFPPYAIVTPFFPTTTTTAANPAALLSTPTTTTVFVALLDVVALVSGEHQGSDCDISGSSNVAKAIIDFCVNTTGTGDGCGPSGGGFGKVDDVTSSFVSSSSSSSTDTDSSHKFTHVFRYVCEQQGQQDGKVVSSSEKKKKTDAVVTTSFIGIQPLDEGLAAVLFVSSTSTSGSNDDKAATTKDLFNSISSVLEFQPGPVASSSSSNVSEKGANATKTATSSAASTSSSSSPRSSSSHRSEGSMTYHVVPTAATSVASGGGGGGGGEFYFHLRVPLSWTTTSLSTTQVCLRPSSSSFTSASCAAETNTTTNAMFELDCNDAIIASGELKNTEDLIKRWDLLGEGGRYTKYTKGSNKVQFEKKLTGSNFIQHQRSTHLQQQQQQPKEGKKDTSYQHWNAVYENTSFGIRFTTTRLTTGGGGTAASASAAASVITTAVGGTVIEPRLAPTPTIVYTHPFVVSKHSDDICLGQLTLQRWFDAPAALMLKPVDLRDAAGDKKKAADVSSAADDKKKKAKDKASSKEGGGDDSAGGGEDKVVTFVEAIQTVFSSNRENVVSLTRFAGLLCGTFDEVDSNGMACRNFVVPIHVSTSNKKIAIKPKKKTNSSKRRQQQQIKEEEKKTAVAANKVGKDTQEEGGQKDDGDDDDDDDDQFEEEEAMNNIDHILLVRWEAPALHFQQSVSSLAKFMDKMILL